MTRSIPSRGGAVRSAAATAAAALAATLAVSCGGGAGAAAARPAGPAETAGPAAPAAAAPARPAVLDTAEAVLEASIAAQGGRERIGKIKAIRQIGTFALPRMGMTGTMTSVSAPPQNTLLVIEIPGVGKLRQGVSGDVVWETNPITGARVISGDERAQLLRESTFSGDLAWRQLYPRAELAGVVELAGKPAYKVVLTAADGDAQTRYFARDTLLPLGVDSVARSQMGKMAVSLELSDWREVGGVKYAHRVQRKEGPQTIDVTIEKIEIDPPLDATTFALPPEIAALPGAQAGAASPAATAAPAKAP